MDAAFLAVIDQVIQLQLRISNESNWSVCKPSFVSFLYDFSRFPDPLLVPVLIPQIIGIIRL